jgi:hypothetical protein
MTKARTSMAFPFAVFAKFGIGNAIATAALVRTIGIDAAQCVPKFSGVIGSLVADPGAKDSAIAQRRTAVGLIATRLRSGNNMAFSLIISRPPHSPGPMSLGSNSIAAIAASR